MIDRIKAKNDLFRQGLHQLLQEHEKLTADRVALSGIVAPTDAQRQAADELARRHNTLTRVANEFATKLTDHVKVGENLTNGTALHAIGITVGR